MKVIFDPQVDVLRIIFRDVPIEPGVILDYDKDGMIVGVEILDASKQNINPRSIEYSIAEDVRSL